MSKWKFKSADAWPCRCVRRTKDASNGVGEEVVHTYACMMLENFCILFGAKLLCGLIRSLMSVRPFVQFVDSFDRLSDPFVHDRATLHPMASMLCDCVCSVPFETNCNSFLNWKLFSVKWRKEGVKKIMFMIFRLFMNKFENKELDWLDDNP